MATATIRSHEAGKFLASKTLIPWLEANEPFPPVSEAMVEPDGLLAAGADLSVPRLLDAYRHGIFPWFNEGQPILWWSTDPRMVLFTDELRISQSMRKLLAKVDRGGEGIPVVTCDRAFEQVIRTCAEPRSEQHGTWINEAMINAYLQLHDCGIAHSVETWLDDRLVGGLYGLAIGRMFYGESMFSRASDASKIALVRLVEFLRQRQFPMIDCQQQTTHLASLGARPIGRSVFIERVRDLVSQPSLGQWPTGLSQLRSYDAHQE